MISRLIGIIFPCFIWFIAIDLLALFDATLIPKLSDTIFALMQIVKDGELQTHLFSTANRWFKGLIAGVLTGFFSGLLLSQISTLKLLTSGGIEYLRSIPVTALIPLFLAFFGIGDFSRIMMVALPTALLMTVAIENGAQNISLLRCDMAKNFDANKTQIVFHVIIPEMIPAFFTTLKLAISISLVVVIVSEMFVGTEIGIGQRIFESYMMSAMEVLFAYLLVLGLLGLSINYSVERLDGVTLKLISHICCR